MKYKTNFKKGSRIAWSPFSLLIKSLILSTLLLTGIHVALQAQEFQYTKPTWYFGGAIGANFNFYRGSTQELNSDLTVPAAFHDGKGVGLYLAPLVEFHRPDTRWGAMLQVGYDNRKGKYEEIITPCNCPADLSAKPSYITVEPSLRLAPFKSNFYLYIGPRLAFNMTKSFTYSIKINPNYPEQLATPDIKGDFSNMNKILISMQIGAGYDIPLSSQNKRTQFVLSPFISLHPYFGQDPRSIETWNVTTLRIGAALKFGNGSKSPIPTEPAILDSDYVFTVNSPRNLPSERRVRETFPLRNYVFFDLGSAEIPDRYVLLTKDQVKDFKEDQLEVFKPKKLSGRSDRQMTIYYNVINILGDRMGKNPKAIVRLSGNSMEGKEDGLAMAESIRLYLTRVFGIDPARINTEGRIKPRIPSEQPGGVLELELLREGDRRVSIWSDSPAILEEFQSGPEPLLKPLLIVALQEAPPDSYVSLSVKGGKEPFISWTIEFKDKNDKVQLYGPYYSDKASIPGKSILGNKTKGDYKVKMIGLTKDRETITKETTTHIVLWTPPKREEGLRFSVIFEFNESNTIVIYDKYLTEVVTPKIPKNATVIIHGHTDVIGEEAYNQQLSVERANKVGDIIKKALSDKGRTDVTMQIEGFGEDQTLSPFENKLPEERFYNRTVIIDIIPRD